jgi:hypothetical protein
VLIALGDSLVSTGLLCDHCAGGAWHHRGLGSKEVAQWLGHWSYDNSLALGVLTRKFPLLQHLAHRYKLGFELIVAVWDQTKT